MRLGHAGSHLGRLLPRTRTSPENWQLTLPVDGAGESVPLRAGEAVLFSGLTLHRSLANRSHRPRRASFVEYAEADACRGDSERKPLIESPHGWMVAGSRACPEAEDPLAVRNLGIPHRRSHGRATAV